jgi:hypothetical protein
VLFVAEQLEVLEGAVSMVAVFPPDAVAFRNPTVRGFPHSLVDKLPISVQSTVSVFRNVRDFANEIAIAIELHRSDRPPVARSLTFFELRLAHAPGRVPWPTQSLVRRHDSLLKSMWSPSNAEPHRLESEHFPQVCLAFVKSLLHGLANDTGDRSSENFRELPIRAVGKHLR